MYELKPSPCQSCPRNDCCSNKCEDRENWFIESWQMLRRKLLGVDGNG